ncbi:DUF6230 family protein [Saccharococcus caldoxylosilyticus]|jgi:Family of unknown function (DUF6230)|uniref:Uncharacterized protein n=1 Tax=Saccharococcus caldoxylosilyticus TaxID=81408 RepID=A0A150M4Y9_9BACL|nr:DUF6230 family protein [Parageobacillus caldoxylosilyticus]KYD19667.1 hypothetical protein B4119_3179 [Parageobacillus caldoxylosilyticus]
MMENALNVNKKRLAIIGGAGMLGLIALLLVLFMSGTVFAAFPLSGVGGFIISADKITGTNFKLYPSLGETENKPVWAQAAIDLESATINGLMLSKNINTESALGSYNVKSVDVIVTGGDVVGKNLKLRVSGIESDNTLFKNLQVKEYYTDNPLNVIDLQAPNLTLDHPKLNTHFLSAGDISIPGMKLKIVANMKDGSKLGDF